MKKLILLFSLMMVVSCQETINTEISKELTVLDNSDSEEITFILELNTKGNSAEEVENFTQYLSDFIVERCNVIDSKQVSNLEQFLQHFFDKWNFETDNKVYGSFNGRALPGVVVNCLATQLHEHAEKAEINRPFVIMSSLRNVDISEGVKVYNNA